MELQCPTCNSTDTDTFHFNKKLRIMVGLLCVMLVPIVVFHVAGGQGNKISMDEHDYDLAKTLLSLIQESLSEVIKVTAIKLIADTAFSFRKCRDCGCLFAVSSPAQ